MLGLEGHAPMVQRARQNAEANGVGHVTFRAQDLHGRDPQVRGFDAAVLDPPRTGAWRLVDGLAAAGVSRILYVSCAPPTLARDAAALAAAGYRLERIGLVDMFPQTTHVEVMALFSADHASRRSKVTAARGDADEAASAGPS